MEKTQTPPLKPWIKLSAQFAVLAPLLGLAFNCILSSQAGDNRISIILVGAFFGLLVLAGLVCSIIALGSVSKYGTKGLLGYGVTGLILNTLIILIFVAGYVAVANYAKSITPLTKEQAQNAPQMIAGSQILHDELNFYRLEIPPGFELLSSQPDATTQAYTYIKYLEDGTGMALVIDHLKQRFDQTRLKPEDLLKMQEFMPPESSQLALAEYHWKNKTIDGFTMQLTQGNVVMFASNVQVPMLPGAIQINLSATPAHEQEVRDTLQQILGSVVATPDGR